MGRSLEQLCVLCRFIASCSLVRDCSLAPSLPRSLPLFALTSPPFHFTCLHLNIYTFPRYFNSYLYISCSFLSYNIHFLSHDKLPSFFPSFLPFSNTYFFLFPPFLFRKLFLFYFLRCSFCVSTRNYFH